MRKFLRYVLRFLFRLLSRVHVEGLENVPRRGAAILAANHLSRLDGPLVFALIERQDLTGLVADKYLKSWWIRPLVQMARGIWINRERTDFGALRTALQHLQRGGMLGIAPEGTRSQNGTLRRAKSGVAFLARKASAPIVPLAIWGTETAMRQLLRFQRPEIFVRIGRPFEPPPPARNGNDQGLEQSTDEIMCRIAALLPPRYRGVYADHPRLKALLAGEESLSSNEGATNT